MALYRTYAGKLLDMDALRLQNARAIAAGNMGVNANGDSIKQDRKTVRQRSMNSHLKRKRHSKRISLKPELDENGNKIYISKPPAVKTEDKKPVKKVISRNREKELDDGSIEIQEKKEDNQ